MRIVVCAKLVPDPEGPPSAFHIDSEAKAVIPVGIPPVINPFDENALEAALRIKDQCDSARVTVMSVGAGISKSVLMKALAAGADELILLDDERFADLDSYSTAYVLSAAIRKLGNCELVFTGRQAADWNFGQVGLIMGEMLRFPSVNLVCGVEISDGEVVVKKSTEEGFELLKVSVPALLTVSNEIGELRSISMTQIKEAMRKSVVRWGPRDLNIDPSELKRRKPVELFAPPFEKKCVFVEGETPEEAGVNLAMRLRRDKVI